MGVNFKAKETEITNISIIFDNYTNRVSSTMVGICGYYYYCFDGMRFYLFTSVYNSAGNIIMHLLHFVDQMKNLVILKVLFHIPFWVFLQLFENIDLRVVSIKITNSWFIPPFVSM